MKQNYIFQTHVPARPHREGMLRFAWAVSECVHSDGSGEDRSETELPHPVIPISNTVLREKGLSPTF